ncbi:MAG: HupE/UreJ family protein [Solirubrobacterales bacterium]|nr:HupE/UreJ family protein [Solirubrobacterales bacterium]
MSAARSPATPARRASWPVALIGCAVVVVVMAWIPSTSGAHVPGSSAVGTGAENRRALEITDGDPTAPVGEMISLGYHHVLDGADHLLFLLALLLPAPLIATAGRWRPSTEGPLSTLTAVLEVVTAFTLGHSITLLAAALGWVTVPARPIEILIAASVGVAAINAVRPMARRGEAAIAAGFGLVHGLAFAGILSDLGLAGSASLASLLAFNFGVELAQLSAVALVFPSLYLLSRTRFYPTVRVTGACLALAAATGWGLDRAGALANPLAGVEAVAIGHLWLIVVGLAGLAGAAWIAGPSPAGPGRADLPDLGPRLGEESQAPD